MDYTIHPYEGLGPIKFGMTPSQVREIIGEPDETTESFIGQHPIDIYDKLGFSLGYDNETRQCDQIGLTGPASTPAFSGRA